MAMEASITRIVDFAITALCVLRQASYGEIASELLHEYRPHRDKSRMRNRLIELKREMDGMKRVEEDSALFDCFKRLAGLALDAVVYLKTEYPLELERSRQFHQGQTGCNDKQRGLSVEDEQQMRLLRMEWM